MICEDARGHELRIEEELKRVDGFDRRRLWMDLAEWERSVVVAGFESGWMYE